MESNTPATTSTQQPALNKPATVKSLLEREGIKKRFEEILGAKAAGFISSVINLVNSNANLSQCDPNSVIMAAAVAATLDLPINPNLGLAYIIPYKTKYQEAGQWKEKYVAQFQMGYKGFIQLAKRSGQYLKINAIEIRAGQLKKVNPLTEDFEFDFSVEGGEVVGFAAYFKEVNGFEKTLYWNVGQVNKHAAKFSKAFKDQKSPWNTDFEEMAKKTLLKWSLSKYGTLSIEMQKAVRVDQAVIKSADGESVDYVDATHTDVTNQQAISETPSNPGTETNSQQSNNSIPTAEEL